MVNTTRVVNGVNRIKSADRVVHDWYRFVLSFPPHLVRQYLDDFQLKPGQTILDPFCGTGTTIVEARKQGYAAIGIESNPMACFASSVKVNWEVDPDGFEQDSRRIAEQADVLFTQQGLNSHSDLPLFTNRQTGPTHLRSLNAEQTKLLLSRSISPRPLHRVLELLDLIRSQRKPWTPHQELALATALVADASNLKFGPEVGVRRTARLDADVSGHWLERVGQMAADLRSLQGASFPPAGVYCGDARSFSADIEADCIITSPPYPNEKDYTRATRLESVILGFISNRHELRVIKENLIRNNTRNVYVTDQDDTWIEPFASVQQLAEQIEAKRLELGKTSGFEKLYHRVVRLYFGGMHRHLRAVQKMLTPGALCAYVVGDQESFFQTPVRTGELLAEIAEYCGYKVERIDLWRTRLATATGTQLREEVVILRWPG